MSPTAAEWAVLRRKAFGPSYIWAHRGGVSAPEDSTESWLDAVLAGYCAEGDIRQSSDGVQFLMHDATVDRTAPPNTGAINTFTAAALDAMRYDRWNPVGFAAAPVSRFSAALAAVAANNGWCAPEAEIVTQVGMQAVIDAAKLAGNHQRCIFQMFEVTPYTVLSAIAAANPGVNLLVAFNTGSAQPNFATIAAAGIKYVAMDINDAWVTRAVFDSGHALGLKFVPYTVDSLAQLAIAQTAGADHVFSNRPRFLARGVLASPAPMNEPWTGASKWLWGDDWVKDGIVIPSTQYARPNNGECGTQDITVVTVPGAYLQGRPLPVAAQSYQLDFTINLKVANADATRYMALEFALQQDGCVRSFGPVPAGFNGYGCVFRQNGAFSIDKYVALAASTQIATAASTALAVGTPIPFRLTVTPTQLTLLRVDTAVSCTVADAAFRGGIAGLVWGTAGAYIGPIVGITIP